MVNKELRQFSLLKYLHIPEARADEIDKDIEDKADRTSNSEEHAKAVIKDVENSEDFLRGFLWARVYEEELRKHTQGK